MPDIRSQSILVNTSDLEILFTRASQCTIRKNALTVEVLFGRSRIHGWVIASALLGEIKHKCDFDTVDSFLKNCWGYLTLIIEELNPLTTNVAYHMESSQLICNQNQLSGFYIIKKLYGPFFMYGVHLPQG